MLRFTSTKEHTALLDEVANGGYTIFTAFMNKVHIYEQGEDTAKLLVPADLTMS